MRKNSAQLLNNLLNKSDNMPQDMYDNDEDKSTDHCLMKLMQKIERKLLARINVTRPCN